MKNVILIILLNQFNSDAILTLPNHVFTAKDIYDWTSTTEDLIKKCYTKTLTPADFESISHISKYFVDNADEILNASSQSQNNLINFLIAIPTNFSVEILGNLLTKPIISNPKVNLFFGKITKHKDFTIISDNVFRFVGLPR